MDRKNSLALFLFKCIKCNNDVKKILTFEQSKLEYLCPKDGEKLIRNPQNPTSSTKDTIDNGLQIRKIEQYTDSAELMIDRENNQRKDKNKQDL